ncbi:MAG TPA: molybdopterin-dependent oxidoreductase [Armatimonadota bacterium]|jgi:formate dehydrogenase alpha subunit|nr:molybdopterin-dependent oxidoreductase [Armatimonadota bacterium]HPO73120.1 molybdopterin-dependent oxidoreductase [Armatimonadota bacterium]
MSDITMTIDGREVRAKQGQTVLEVCREHGIYLPTLCHWPGLSNVGACRLCVVEVEGTNKLGTSCTMPAADGLKIRTQSEALTARRKMTLELLFSERNHFCPVCPESGACELQDLGYRFGIDSIRYPYLFPALSLDVSHDYIAMEPSRCVLCQRCVRICSERVGVSTLDFRERGIQQMISPDMGLPLGESSCVSCGACMQVCPTGAIFAKKTAYLERAATAGGPQSAMRPVASTCAGCSLGCRTLVQVSNDRVVRIDADMEAGDAGILCRKGRFMQMEFAGERITQPLVREGDTLKPTDWDTALATVADRLGKIVRERGASAVAGIASPALTNEVLYLFQKVMRAGVGTGNIDAIDGRDLRVSRAATEGLLGPDVRAKVEVRLADLDEADLFVVIGADPTRTHPVAAAAIRRGVYHRRAKLIVINPRKTGLTDLADLAVQPKRGTDGTLLNGVMRALVEAKGGAPAALTAMLMQYTPEAVAAETGVSTDELQQLAEAYTAARHPVLIYGRGITKQNDPRLIATMQALTLVAGHATATSFPILGLRRSASSTGAFDLGVDPTRLPGRLRFTPAEANRFASAWGKPVPEPTSFNANEFDPKAIGALYLLIGDDTLPQEEEMAERLAELEFVVVQATYRTPLTEVADVVLPAPTWAEQSGTFTGIDGQVRPLRQAVTPPEGVRMPWDVLCSLGNALGLKGSYANVAEVAHEIGRLVPEYAEALATGERAVHFRDASFDVRRSELRAPDYLAESGGR